MAPPSGATRIAGFRRPHDCCVREVASIFLGNAPLLVLTTPDSDAEGPAGPTLRRDYFGMHRFEWPDDESVEFHLTHGDWIRLFRRTGFEIENLIELQAPARATTRYPWVTLEWARRWPSEEVWVVRRTQTRAR